MVSPDHGWETTLAIYASKAADPRLPPHLFVLRADLRAMLEELAELRRLVGRPVWREIKPMGAPLVDLDERLDRVRARAEDDGPETLWNLSFCDPDRPAGDQWLGSCIVGPARNLVAAMALSHAYRCNPGGEMQGVGFPVELAGFVPREFCDRLLTREDIAALDALIPAQDDEP